MRIPIVATCHHAGEEEINENGEDCRAPRQTQASSGGKSEAEGNVNVEFKKIFQESHPFALGFITSLGVTSCEHVDVKELFIDSTFKTNRQKIELFAVLGTVLGTGFPIAYLLLAPTDEINVIPRKEILKRFLSAMRDVLPNVRPIFFFSDKDAGQLNAIRQSYGIHPSLCVWHMKKAIQRKIADLRGKEKYCFSKRREEELFFFIDQHYNLHPFLTGQTLLKQFKQAVRDVKRFLCEKEDEKFLTYLLVNWYSDDVFQLWGRQVPGQIPLSRTTMFVEAHWSKFKCGALVKHNRPRIDLVVYLLATDVLPSIKTHLFLLVNGSIKPNWVVPLNRGWKNANAAILHNVFKTDVKNSTCTCMAFFAKPFLFLQTHRG